MQDRNFEFLKDAIKVSDNLYMKKIKCTETNRDAVCLLVSDDCTTIPINPDMPVGFNISVESLKKVLELSESSKDKEDFYIQTAKDHLGTACRDNSRQELIEIGKQIDDGTWED